jgi:predicted nucleic acid-binding protein
MDVRIPVVVLSETLRGSPRDAPVHRVRNAVDVFPTTEAIAKVAAGLLGKTGGKNTADALVAAEALASHADLVTSDPEDMKDLLRGRHAVRVVVV